METRSKYDQIMADDLDLSLIVFHNLVDKMIEIDLSNFYFYLGSYHFSKDIDTKRKIDNIVKKYQREDKLMKILS